MTCRFVVAYERTGDDNATVTCYVPSLVRKNTTTIVIVEPAAHPFPQMPVTHQFSAPLDATATTATPTATSSTIATASATAASCDYQHSNHVTHRLSQNFKPQSDNE